MKLSRKERAAQIGCWLVVVAFGAAFFGPWIRALAVSP